MNYENVVVEEPSHQSHRSMSLSSASSDVVMDTAATSSLDHLFPLFDEITRIASQKFASSSIIFFIISIEAFISGYFPFLPDCWDFDNSRTDKVLRYFAYLLDFGNGDKNALKTFAPSIVIILLALIIFAWFCSILQFYHSNKTFNRTTVFITRFIFSYFIPILLIPNMFCLGFNFNAIFNETENQGIYIALTVFSFIFAIILYFLFYLDIIFRSSTPYLEKSCLSMWDGQGYFLFLLTHGLAAFSSRLLVFFPAWTRYFLIACYCMLMTVLVLNCFYFIYIYEPVNTIMGALQLTNVITAILAVCPISSLIRLIFPIPFFFLSTIGFYFALKITRKYILKHRSLAMEGTAIQTMRAVLSDDPKSFVDWTLIRQITATFPTTNVFMKIAQILAFFPSESQLLNHYVMIISKHSDLKLHERFMFFQIRRVHVLRQSSATKQFNFDFEEVKKATSKMIACFSQLFSSNNELSIGTLVGIVKLNRKTNAICLEALEKYPNSARLAYEYSRYLIECHAEFKEGASWHYKAELMDTGKHTAIDYSFRAMVNLFPIYLKKDILDYKGKKIVRSKKDKGSASSNSSITRNSVDLDDEANEEQAEKIFDKPRLRFALKRAVDNMKCAPLELIYQGSFIRFFITFVVFISLYFGFRNFFNGRLDNTVLMGSVATVREVLSVGLASLCHLVSIAMNMINHLYYPEEKVQYDIFNNTLQSMVLGIKNGIKASQVLGALLASKGTSILEIADDYLFKGGVHYCLDNGTQLPLTETSTRSLSYFLLSQLLNAPKYISMTMSKTAVICELIGNTPLFQAQMDVQTIKFTNRESATADGINKGLELAFILTPIALIMCLLFPLMIGLILMNKDLKKLFSAVVMLPKEALNQASKPIAKTEFESTTAASSIDSSQTPLYGIPFVVFLSMVVTTVAIVVVLLDVRKTNNRFMNAALWLETSARRSPYVIESVSDVYFMLFFQISGTTTYGSVAKMVAKLKKTLDLVMQLNRDLLLGKGLMPPCVDFSPKLDEIHFESWCDFTDDEASLHGNYHCLSVDQMMMVYSKFVDDLLVDYESDPTKLIGKTEPFTQLTHLVFYHLFPKLVEVQDILSDSCQDLIDQTNLNNGVTLISCYVAVAFLFVLEVIINSKMKASYNTLKILIARFPPNAVISNQNLLDLIIGKSTNKREKQSSAAQSVIDSSPDAILALSSEYTIESMNPAACHIFGYTPEQILGQSITTLIPNPEEGKEAVGSSNAQNSDTSLYRQFALMKANQASMTYSCQAIGLKDDETEVNLEVTLIGINDGQYFALIANDQTIVLKQQKEVEDAKKQAEKLLYQILPRDIVTRMNRGEKDISFTVPSATISFIDIVKFSDYMAALTPKQVMQNLGKYFKSWDDLLQKYKTIIKIKLIGDVYMAAAGLFNPEMSPNTHAIEMLSFTIDGVRALDEINHSLEANLSVRIGVNTGGPVIAGVLGIDKPLFDIIGDPINVAARLQSMDIANNIQISQVTYDLVKDKNFDIEKRGEIVLKGKGAQMAYLVHPSLSISDLSGLGGGVSMTGSTFRLPRLTSTAKMNNMGLNMSQHSLLPPVISEKIVEDDGDSDAKDEKKPLFLSNFDPR